MGMTAAEMMSRMSAREYRERLALSRLEPSGEWRWDFRVGLAMSRLINLILALFAKDPKFTTIADFMVDFGKPPGVVSSPDKDETSGIKVTPPKRVWERFMALAKLFPGSKVVDKRGKVIKVLS